MPTGMTLAVGALVVKATLTGVTPSVFRQFFPFVRAHGYRPESFSSPLAKKLSEGVRRTVCFRGPRSSGQNEAATRTVKPLAAPAVTTWGEEDRPRGHRVCERPLRQQRRPDLARARRGALALYLRAGRERSERERR